MYRKTILTTVTALLTIATGCPATAQQLNRVVSYRDLDLAGPAGAKAFHRRIQRAINAVCRRPSPAYPLTGVQDQECRAEVTARAQPKMLDAILLAETRAASQLAAR